MLMDFYRVHPKPSRLTSAAREQWASVSSVRHRTAESRRPTAADRITLTTSEIRAVSAKHNTPSGVYLLNKQLVSPANADAGYSPHPTYGMVVQPDYTNSYPGYGPNAYQCSGPYGSSLGPGVYPVSSVPSPYSPTTTSCYAMPPPQHLPSHDKLLSKDGWVSLHFAFSRLRNVSYQPGRRRTREN